MPAAQGEKPPCPHQIILQGTSNLREVPGTGVYASPLSRNERLNAQSGTSQIDTVHAILLPPCGQFLTSGFRRDKPPQGCYNRFIPGEMNVQEFQG